MGVIRPSSDIAEITIDKVAYQGVLYAMEQKEFQKEIIAHRQRLGWNQKIMAARIGCKYETWRNWERGRNMPIDLFAQWLIEKLEDMP